MFAFYENSAKLLSQQMAIKNFCTVLILKVYEPL